MPVPIVMPKLGMVMTEGTIAKLSKKAGETVALGRSHRRDRDRKAQL